MDATRQARWRVRAVTGGVVGALVAGLVTVLYQPWLAQWGSTSSERRGAVVGDAIVDADLTWTRSITIDAPAEAVWPWLVQMGVDRGGFYNYDWGEQLFGDPVHNATSIHPEWQDLEVGDAIHPFPGQDWTVTILEPNRSLVLTNPAMTPTDWSWATELRPLGVDQTRVVTRIRSEKGSAFSYLLDPPDLILFPRLLTGLEQRAEGTLPGLPGTHTGQPFPLARLPVPVWAAGTWVVGLAALGLGVRRQIGLGRWHTARAHPHITFWGGFVLGTGYLLMSDTPPIQFVTHTWVAGLALGAVTGVIGRRVLDRRGTHDRSISRSVVALVETGVFVLVPATAVWQAATALGWTTSLAAHVGIGLVAVTAATLVAAAAWAHAAHDPWSVVGFACILAGSYTATGSGLAPLLAAAIVELSPNSVPPDASELSVRGESEHEVVVLT